jgi:hypothetical protein
MGHVGVSISMAYAEVENLMAALILGLILAKGLLEAMKTVLHRLSWTWIAGLFVHFEHIACVSAV